MRNWSFHIVLLALLFLSVTLPAQSFASDLPAKTGQTTSYAAGDDGDLKKGVGWPSPRFTDNDNGTVTDHLTDLIWLKNANCPDTVGGIYKGIGTVMWVSALTWSNALASGACGLNDGSTAGQWRLPNINELESLVDTEHSSPALPAGHPFINVQWNNNYGYWSSSTYALNITYAWHLHMNNGLISPQEKYTQYVWPVRDGQ